uniref:PXA1 n=1 Tax=Arundo donax TaxID=35708 RepID=A0A0A9CGG0_ARUDO
MDGGFWLQGGGPSQLFPVRCLPVGLWRMPGQARASREGVRKRIMVTKPVHWPRMGTG